MICSCKYYQHAILPHAENGRYPGVRDICARFTPSVVEPFDWRRETAWTGTRNAPGDAEVRAGHACRVGRSIASPAQMA
jgi:hypothetical protein